MLVMWLALTTLAPAGTPVTLNGVDISSVRDQRFKAVDVWIDADGNVHLTSDRYEVQYPDGQEAPPAAAATRPKTAPSPSDRTVNPTPPAPPAPSEPPPEPATTPSAPASVTATAPEPAPPAVDAGSWWLATEDNGSRGHEIRVYVNGTLVDTVSSGQPQVIKDISAYLEKGENDVQLQTRSLAAGGGGFYVYIGEGSNAGGTVTLEQPTIQHGLGPSRTGDDVRQYTLFVE